MTRNCYFVMLKTWKINSPVTFPEEKKPNNQHTDSLNSKLHAKNQHSRSCDYSWIKNNLNLLNCGVLGTQPA